MDGLAHAWVPPELPELCRYITERSPQPMVAVQGPEHIVRYINPAFRRLVGNKHVRLVGVPFSEAVPEGLANECDSMLDRVYASGATESLAEQAHAPGVWEVQPHDTTYWSYLAWAILGPGDAPIGVMIQVTDATELAAFRRSLTRANQELVIAAVREHERRR